MIRKILVSMTAALSFGAAVPAFGQPVSGDCPPEAASSRDGFFSFLGNWNRIWNPWAGQWCSNGSTGLPGWATRAPGATPTTDATAGFKDAHARAKAGQSPLPADANQYTYLMVGGLYTEHYLGYMDDNVKRLQDRGLDVRRVSLDTDAGVAVNAESIRKAIVDAARETGKKVVILGHSKGGVDTAAALATFPDELTPLVRANIAMQAPYGGSPVATDIQGCPRLRHITDNFVTSIWGGSAEAMVDLTYEARKKFIAAHPYPAGIPTVSLATARLQPGSILNASERYMKSRYGLASDGLVVQQDAEIPGSRVIRLDDMDHAEGTSRGVPGFPNYWPGDITEALIAVALSPQ